MTGPRGDPPRGGRDNVSDRRRGEGVPGISLLVRNIAPQITDADLGQAFGRIGEVRDVYIPRDYHSRQPKGFAFIEYADPEREFFCVVTEANQIFLSFLVSDLILFYSSPPFLISFKLRRGS